MDDVPEKKESEPPDLALVRKHAEQLGEHFDSVQIFVTRHEAGELDGTVTVSRGVGNFYSRYGQVAEWMVKQDEWTRLKARKDE